MKSLLIPSSMAEMERALQDALADAKQATPSVQTDHRIGLIQDLLVVAQSPQPNASGPTIVVVVGSQPHD